MAWFSRGILLMAVVFVVIQSIRPARTNPPVDPGHELIVMMPVNAAVAATLQRSCYDCHSNKTVWPKYSHVAPASWLVAYDVRQGRRTMNFSDWASYTPQERQKLLGAICKEVSEGEMPGLPYSLLHPDSKLSLVQVQQVCEWTTSSAGLAERIE
jgi:hypothetical protein